MTICRFNKYMTNNKQRWTCLITCTDPKLSNTFTQSFPDLEMAAGAAEEYCDFIGAKEVVSYINTSNGNPPQYKKINGIPFSLQYAVDKKYNSEYGFSASSYARGRN